MQVFAASDADGNLIASATTWDELAVHLGTGGWIPVFEPGVEGTLEARRKRVANVYDERSPGSELPTPEVAWGAMGNLRLDLEAAFAVSEEEAVDVLAGLIPPNPQSGRIPRILRDDIEGRWGERDVDSVVSTYFLRQNYKTLKTRAQDELVSTVGLALINAKSWKNVAPGSLPRGTDLCVGASQYCSRTCLIASGHQKSRFHYEIKLAFTRMLFDYPEAFARLLFASCYEHSKCPRGRSNYFPAVRLNVFSDIPWELVFPDLFAEIPDLQFYDYTKLVLRVVPPNYDLTFSTSGTNTDTAVGELARGRRLAVVFNLRKGEPLPATWRGVPVIDGDLSDARFLEPNDVVVGLRYKSVGGLHYKTDRKTAFVHLAVYDEPDDVVISETIPSQEPSWSYLDPDEVVTPDLVGD